MSILRLSIKNLLLYKRRYTVISIAIVMAFSIMMLTSSLSAGAIKTLSAKASRYLAGHICVNSYQAANKSIFNSDDVVNEIKKTNIRYNVVSKRSLYTRNNAMLLFGGEKIQQRRLVGLDFENELPFFLDLEFDEGSANSMLGESADNGIIISRVAAKALGVRVGDDISIYLTTDSGQVNAANLIVRGIFTDASLFAYAAYMDIEVLNSLVNRPRGSFTDIAIYINDNASIMSEAEKLRLSLKNKFNVLDQIKTRKSYYDLFLNNTNPELTLAVIPLDAQLDQISYFINAFWIVSYFIIAVFILITMVGIINTYRVIVYERTQEIGIMRAMGMGRKKVIALFVLEAVMLSFVSSLIGFLFGCGFVQCVSLIDFSFIPATNMVTSKGHLSGYLDLGIITIDFVAMMICVILAVLGPSFNAAKIQPSEAMRTAT